MHRYIFLLLIGFLFSSQKGTAQIELENVNFCSYGWNEICIDHLVFTEDIEIIEEATPIYFNGDGSLNGPDFPTVKEGNCIRFFIDSWIPPNGDFFFVLLISTSAGNNTEAIFTGVYTTEGCQDYLILPPNFCGNNIIFKPAQGLITHWNPSVYPVCVGDTLHVNLSPFTYASTDTPNQPFSPDRLCLNNGYLINVEDYSFDIVWETPGLDSLSLNTNGLITGHTIIIKESNNLTIEGPTPNVNTETICAGESIFLSSSSEDGQYLTWEVSDGRGFTGLNIDLQFDQPGTYTVTLEEDACSCNLPAEFIIIVLEGEYTDIDCTGTTCEGNTHIYHSTNFCDTYLWSVSGNGTITDGGGSNDYFIEVIWNDGPVGDITLSTPGCFSSPCRETTTVEIPILSNDLVIDGLQKVCIGKKSVYTIPNYRGTDIDWALSGGGNIVSGLGTNQIIIQWSAFTQVDMAQVSVILNNCVLGCSSMAVLDVVLLPELDILADRYQACQNQPVILMTEPSISVDWTITSPSGGMSNRTGLNTITESFSEVGEYTVLVKNNGSSTCNEEATTKITVSPPPLAPTGLIGPTVVCKDVFSNYSIVGLSGIDQVIWEVYDGSSPTPSLTTTSRSLQYTWTTFGPYRITAQIIDGQTGCTSDIESYPLTEEFSITGSSSNCIYNEEIYTLENYASGDIDWTILPSTAGTIVTQSGGEIIILWQQEGNHTVTATHCGGVKSISVDVIDLNVGLNFPMDICPGELAQVEVLGPATGVTIRNDIGSIVSTNLTSMLSAGIYTLDITDINGCEDYQEIEIAEYEEIIVDIILNGSDLICPPSTTLLTSSVSPLGIYTYQWYHQGIPIPGAINDSHNAGQPGVYRLEITDINGCIKRSNLIGISVCCGPSTPIPLVNALIIDSTNITCFIKDFEVLPPITSTALSWEIRNLTYPGSSTYLGNPITHDFTRAGLYWIRVFGNENCEEVEILSCGSPVDILVCEYGEMFIEIKYVADFETATACLGDTTYFTNTSTTLPPVPGLQYMWDFGDPASGIDNSSFLENPFHVYNAGQDYTVTLELFDPAVGCISTYTETISVPSPPDSDFDYTQELCLGLDATFEVSNPDPMVNYIWNFGDTISGKNTKAYGANTEYKYVFSGLYDVTLTAINDRGCQSLTTKVITILENDIMGDIVTDKIYPMCPGDAATLSSSNTDVGNTYLWSTNETTASITVSTSGSYSLTITNSAGCVYSPSPHNVSIFDIGDAKILGTIRNNNQELITTEDSLTICVGGYAEIEASTVLNAEYTWSVTGTGSYSESLTGQHIPFFPHFNNLPIGEYEYNVSIRDTISDCERSIGPYFVSVVSRPLNPTIVSSPAVLCANEDVTLSVDNPQASETYIWSNGGRGTSIVANSPGLYFVTAYTQGGCARQSSSVFMRTGNEIPDWMSGCIETCFPLEVCISLFSSTTYELLLNGESQGTINNTNTTLTLNEPGDYQISSVSSSGCTATTEMLSLSALPQNHNLEGIVYIDYNENDMYDIGDSLLNDIPVYVCNGNTAIDSINTDVAGTYSFTDLPYSNMTAKIDPSILGSFFSGNTDSLLIYSDCLEDKIINFPLRSSCTEFIADTTLMVCPGENILFNGLSYTEGQLDTLLIDVAGDCDSLLYIDVMAFPNPEINITPNSTCTDENNGSLHFQNIGTDPILYSINNGTLSTDTLVENLSSGVYDITLFNEANCPYEYQVTINGLPLPEVNIDAQLVCNSDVTGTATINTFIGSGLQYSLDLTSGFSTDSIFNNLPLGDYTLYILADNGCQSIEQFSIENYPQPEISILVNEACPTESNGSIELSVISGSGLSYSLSSSGPFIDTPIFTDLNIGMQTLYISDINGCLHEETFEITNFTFDPPNLSTESTCIGENSGFLEIYPSDTDMEYQIDNGDIFTDLSVSGLSSGNHTLYNIYPNGCMDSLSFSISEYTNPTIQTATQNECQNLQGGQLSITTTDSNIQYSLDGIDYSNETEMTDLDAGLYDLYVLTGNGCNLIIPFEISIQLEPEIEITPNSTCVNESNGSLEITNLTSQNLEYSINNIDFTNDVIFENLESNTYTIKVKNSIGCEYEYDVSIPSLPIPFVDAITSNSCLDYGTGAITILDISENTMISLDGGDFGSTMEFIDMSVGMHLIKVQDSFGCTNEIEIEVLPNPELDVEFPPLNADCNDSEVNISPQIMNSFGEVSFNWSDGSDTEFLSTSQPGTYAVSITDDCAETEYAWNLDFALAVDEDDVHIPNIFSPNADGANDCFLSALNPGIELISFHQIIFDRWGNKMFESNDISFCWDGIYMDKPVRPGVFVYITEVLTNQCDGPKMIRKVGDVTVIR